MKTYGTKRYKSAEFKRSVVIFLDSVVQMNKSDEEGSAWFTFTIFRDMNIIQLLI